MWRIGFDLTLLFAELQVHNQAHPGTPFTTSSTLPLMVAGETVAVDVVGAGDLTAFRNQLAGLGMTGIVSTGSMVEGRMPISQLDDLAALPALRFARPVYQPITRVGSTTSQGDSAMRVLVQEARMESDPGKIEKVRELLGELRESWAQIAGVAG